MMNILELKESLEGDLNDVTFTLPPKAELGLLTTNAAFIKAKADGISPIQAAEEIKSSIKAALDNLELSNDFEVNSTGPYVNVSVTRKYLDQQLNNQGISNLIPKLTPNKENVLIDYFALNAAKQAHIGHIRSGNIGESIRRILLLKYQHVITDRHLGDWGVQFGLVVWGIRFGIDYNLTRIDFNNPDKKELIKDLETLYVEVNALIKDKPEIRKQAQKICYELESEFLTEGANVSIWYDIVTTTIEGLKSVAQTLNLNKNGFWNDVNYTRRQDDKNWNDEVEEVLRTKRGIWEDNQVHKEYHHDIDLGESFLFGYFIQEIKYWHELGLVQKESEGENEKYFIDLEEEKLGRVHLISSDGYTTYMFRDVVARFVWSGLLNIDHMLSFVDNRQSHSFKQAFAIIARLNKAGAYLERTFPLLTREQTDAAITKLTQTPPQHVANGYLLLTTGAMSSRKGNVFHFDTLMKELNSAVEAALKEKNYSSITESKITTIAIAALKWADLNRDREQDVVFDIKEVTSFEGNTGVYQLYTYARLNAILTKSREIDNKLGSGDIQSNTIKPDYNSDTLTENEMNLLKQTLQLPLVLESICQSYKPHLLCNYVYELSTMINSWYAKSSVLGETDPDRKNTLLGLTDYLKDHLSICLQLLGIDVLEQM